MIQALYHRKRTGEAQSVDTSILNAGLLCASMASFARRRHAVAAPPARRHAAGSFIRCTASTRRRDGWVCLAAVTRRGPAAPWLDRARASTDRFGRGDDELTDALEPWFASRTASAAFAALDRHGVPCEIADPTSASACYDDPEMRALGLVVKQQHPKLGRFEHFGITIDFSDTPERIWGPPPVVGQHTREIMHEYGYDDADVDKLVEIEGRLRGVVVRVTASAVAAPVHSPPIRFDVSGAVPFPGATLSGWVCAPTTLDREVPVVVFACLAGGGCSTGYWDAVADDVPDASMARYVATRSCVVVALDHLGIGRSSPIDDIYRVTPTIAAAAQDHALRRAITGLRNGTLAEGMPAVPDVVPIGVGHSMGGMILGVQQALHRTFDAVAVLGHGGDGMPEALTAEEAAIDVEQPLVAIETDVAARARLRFAPDTTVERRDIARRLLPPRRRPGRGAAAFEAQRAPLLYSSGLVSMIPGATDHAKRAIDVPAFLAFGDHDLSSDYFGNMARYRSSRDVTLFVLPDAAHCHNYAVTRTVLWDRLIAWARGVSQISAPGNVITMTPTRPRRAKGTPP